MNIELKKRIQQLPVHLQHNIRALEQLDPDLYLEVGQLDAAALVALGVRLIKGENPHSAFLNAELEATPRELQN